MGGGFFSTLILRQFQRWPAQPTVWWKRFVGHSFILFVSVRWLGKNNSKETNNDNRGAYLAGGRSRDWGVGAVRRRWFFLCASVRDRTSVRASPCLSALILMNLFLLEVFEWHYAFESWLLCSQVGRWKQMCGVNCSDGAPIVLLVLVPLAVDGFVELARLRCLHFCQESPQHLLLPRPPFVLLQEQLFRGMLYVHQTLMVPDALVFKPWLWSCWVKQLFIDFLKCFGGVSIDDVEFALFQWFTWAWLDRFVLVSVGWVFLASHAKRYVEDKPL